MRVAFLAAGLVLLALGGCEARQGAVPPISPAAAGAPEPQLIETARFEAALARQAPDTRRLAADQDALAARAAALKARAGALAAPVMPAGERARLAAGITRPPAIADPPAAPAADPADTQPPGGQAPGGQAPGGQAPDAPAEPPADGPADAPDAPGPASGATQ